MVHVPDDDGFIYWYDAHRAIQIFLKYLTGAWLFTMAGVAGLDVNAALAVIREVETVPKKRLRLLQEVRYFAAGVMKYSDEQSKKQT